MENLKLNASELLTLKALLECDMEQTSPDVDYADVELLQYYLDRAKVLVKVQMLLGL